MNARYVKKGQVIKRICEGCVGAFLKTGWALSSSDEFQKAVNKQKKSSKRKDE